MTPIYPLFTRRAITAYRRERQRSYLSAVVADLDAAADARNAALRAGATDEQADAAVKTARLVYGARP